MPATQKSHTLSLPTNSYSKEVIVVDDGSTDKTQVQLKSLFPQVIWKTQKNQGVSSARNRGIQEAKSEWIALLDSDDEWHPQKLELQSKYIIDQPGILFFHTDEKWIRKGKKVTPPGYLNKKTKGFFSKESRSLYYLPFFRTVA